MKHFNFQTLAISKLTALSYIRGPLIVALLPLAAFVCFSFGFNSVSLVLAVFATSLLLFIGNALLLSKSNGIPGPRLAKATVLWKLWHVRKGTYTTRLRELHLKFGGIIQVGPREYDIGSSKVIRQCAHFDKISSPYSFLRQFFAHHSLKKATEALKMANIFAYETNMDQCNHTLLEILTGHAQSERSLNVADLIARYAYDMMFSTTTGEAPGFLRRNLDISKLTAAIEEWKFNAILYGSYLRFHPTLTKLMRSFGFNKGFEREISPYLNINIDADSRGAMNQMFNTAEDQADDTRAAQEACVALMLAGSDPVITHIVTSLYHIYQDDELLQRLRREIEGSEIGEKPSIKDLIHAMSHMPLLHAVLLESLRLYHPTADGFSYASPKEGIELGGGYVPSDCTICFTPAAANLHPKIFGKDPAQFNSSRWLGSRPWELKSHMIAQLTYTKFGAGTDRCPGQNLHLAIVTKIITQIIISFDIEMSAVSTPTSPVAMTLNDIKERFIAMVRLPKHIRPVLSSPLRATAPSFAPETTTAPELSPGLTPQKLTFGFDDTSSYIGSGKYATPAGAKESTLNTTTTSVERGVDSKVATGNSLVNVEKGNSPTLSIATTIRSNDTTPLSFTDVQELASVFNAKLTAELIAKFDPTKRLTPRAYIKTFAIFNNGRRARAHEAIERIWEGRLEHQTDQQTKRMYIYVPGSRLPPVVNVAKAARDRAQASMKLRSAATVTVPKPKPAPPKMNGVWGGFAVDEHSRHTATAALSSEEYTAKYRPASDASKAEPRTTFKQKFIQTGEETTNGQLGGPRVFLNIDTTAYGGDGKAITTTADTANKENETKPAVIPPHARPKNFVPPHLRAKAAAKAAEAEQKIVESEVHTNNGSDTDADSGVWVAAKLPSPYFSD